LRVGDIVLVKEPNLPRNLWELARVIRANKSKDGHVRTVMLAMADGSLDSKGVRTRSQRHLERPIDKFILLVEGEGQDAESVPVEEP
jgi:hypothetical protein